MGSQVFKTYREILRSYEKALSSRNRCLKMVPPRPREVAAYTRPLLDFGHQLTALRAFLIERLEPYFADAFAAVSDRGETSSVRYRPGANTGCASRSSARIVTIFKSFCRAALLKFSLPKASSAQRQSR